MEIKFKAFYKNKIIENAIPLSNGSFGYFDLEGYESVFKHSFKGVVIQYIGIKDKNNVEIYLGDIIKVNINVEVSAEFKEWLFDDGQNEIVPQEILCKVIYDENIASYCLETIEPDLHLKSYGFYGDDNSVFEVIGNVFLK